MGRRPAPCNQDCFHCKFADCIIGTEQIKRKAEDSDVMKTLFPANNGVNLTKNQIYYARHKVDLSKKAKKISVPQP